MHGNPAKLETWARFIVEQGGESAGTALHSDKYQSLMTTCRRHRKPKWALCQPHFEWVPEWVPCKIIVLLLIPTDEPCRDEKRSAT
jgi:hypothetical protein